MKVFISWSGDQSKEIGEIFKAWIPSVIQAVKPYFSPSDIDKGARWLTEISRELEHCIIGLLILTKQNLEAPWMMFEAGALSKNIDKAKICPMLFGVEPTDIKGPLTQFQATPFNKEEVCRLIKSINQELADQKLESDVLDNVFEKWWPDLEKKIQSVKSTKTKETVRDDSDILKEILTLTRSINSRTQDDDIPGLRSVRSIFAGSLAGTGTKEISRAIIIINNLFETCRQEECRGEIFNVLSQLANSLKRILLRGPNTFTSSQIAEMLSLLEHIIDYEPSGDIDDEKPRFIKR